MIPYNVRPIYITHIPNLKSICPIKAQILIMKLYEGWTYEQVDSNIPYIVEWGTIYHNDLN